MSKLYRIVPWIDSKEWHDVYDKLFSSQSNVHKKEALKVLYVWKARNPFLPSGIESTLNLLEVYIQDVESNIVESDQLIRLAYSTALMRFVNHMLDNETSKGSSLYQAAKNLGVPDWIVELRHDTAHGNKLPSLDLLRQAAIVSIEWLQKSYWDKHKQCITDYIVSSKKLDEPKENKISALLNFCVSLSFCSHSRCNIKNLEQIPDTEMKGLLVNEATELFGDGIDFSKLKMVSIDSLISLLNSQAKRLFNNDAALYLHNALLSEESLFLSQEVYNLFNNTGKNNKTSLSKTYVQCFEGLLNFLHTHDLLLDFILELIKVTSNDSDHQRCKHAALWVSVIMKSLRMCQQFNEKINITRPGNNMKEKSDLKFLYYHWYPNEKHRSLLFNICKPVPEELMNINFIQPIISTYNPYLTYFVRDLLSLCKPNIPNPIIEKICKLTELIAFPEKFAAGSSKVYTVDDIVSQSTNIDLSIDKMQVNDVVIIDNKMDVVVPLEGKQENTIWKLSSHNDAWSTCPIGILPWQLSKVEDSQS